MARSQALRIHWKERAAGSAPPVWQLRDDKLLHSVSAVVGRFLGDLHVVHMRLAHAGRRNFHELGFLAQLIDGGAAAVAHAEDRTPPTN
jgi:hypothetical protein